MGNGDTARVSSDFPSLDLRPGDASEFANIMRHQGEVVSEGDRCNQHVVLTDGCTVSLKLGTQRPKHDSRLIIEG